MFHYTDEHMEFIKSNIKGTMLRDLTEMFNNHFGVTLKYSQMKTFTARHRLTNGVDMTFSKSHEPFNKNKPRTWTGGEETRFKKGNLPHNYVPVGSERVNGDDYVDIKIADPNKWRGKHLIVWEQFHGRSVPKGHVVIFGDRNRRNFNPNNLILVSRAQLAVMNHKGLIQNDSDLTRSGVIVADIYQKISQLKKRSI